MCFGAGGGGGSSNQPTVSPQETTAIQTQQAYRKQQANNVNNYDSSKTNVIGAKTTKRKRTGGFNTNIVGQMIGSNDNAPTTALKKLMGA